MTPAPITDTLPDDALVRRAPRPLPLPGEFVGPYRLIFELASGGMATIYLAIPDRRFGAHRFVDDDEETEVVTLAVPSTIPPVTRVSSLNAGPARRTWSSARWPRPLFTFALGAFLGAQYFSPTRPNWPAAENAKATELPPKALAKDQPSCAAESPNAEAVSVERIGQPAGASCCDAKASLANTPQKDVDLKPAGGASSRGALLRERREWDSQRVASEAIGVFGNRTITPVTTVSRIAARAAPTARAEQPN